MPVVQFLHRLAQAFADHAGSLQRRAGQQDEEFLAAEAEHHVDIAQVVLDGFRHGLEGFVADGVTVVVVDPLEVVDIEHQHRERLQVAPGQFQFAAERLVHGDAVAGAGQGVAQGGLDRGAIEQGVAQREQQGAEQALQLPLFVFAEALAATEDQFAEVVAVMAQAIAHRMLGAAAELQAQVGARMAVAKGVQRDQLADFLEEQAENPLCLQAALQL